MLQPSSPRPAATSRGPRFIRWLARWRLLLVIIALIVVGTIAIYEYSQPVRSVLAVPVAVGDISASVNANARVRAVHSARLAFPVSGQVVEVSVHEGDVVKAGQALAAQKSEDYDRRVTQALLALASRKLDLNRAQAPPSAQDLTIAQANIQKAALALAAAQANANKNPSPSTDAAREAAQADYDSARASFDRLTAGPTDLELQQLNNSIALAQLDLDSARAALAQTQLIAPYAGVVTEVDAQPGELVGGFTPVVVIADLSNLELFADIDEIDVGAVVPGQSVDVRFDAFPGATVTGRLTTLFPAASDVRGVLVYNARISFDAGTLVVRPGMGATIKIATVDKKNVLLVPSRAIRNAGTQKIVTAIVDGVQENVVVETGVSDGSNTEIISGLAAGEQVVTQ